MIFPPYLESNKNLDQKDLPFKSWDKSAREANIKLTEEDLQVDEDKMEELRVKVKDFDAKKDRERSRSLY